MFDTKLLSYLWGIATGLLISALLLLSKNARINTQTELIQSYEELVDLAINPDSLYDGSWEVYCEVQHLDSLYKTEYYVR